MSSQCSEVVDNSISRSIASFRVGSAGEETGKIFLTASSGTTDPCDTLARLEADLVVYIGKPGSPGSVTTDTTLTC